MLKTNETIDNADELLVKAVESGKNILVTGATGTGKTILTDLLALSVPNTTKAAGSIGVTDEIRGKEAYDFIKLAEEGVQVIANYHVVSPEGAINRLVNLSLFNEKQTKTPEEIELSIKRHFDYIVHLEQIKGIRFISQVLMVSEEELTTVYRSEPPIPIAVWEVK